VVACSRCGLRLLEKCKSQCRSVGHPERSDRLKWRTGVCDEKDVSNTDELPQIFMCYSYGYKTMKMWVSCWHYSECSEYSNRRMEYIFLVIFTMKLLNISLPQTKCIWYTTISISSSIMRCWNGQSLSDASATRAE